METALNLPVPLRPAFPVRPARRPPPPTDLVDEVRQSDNAQLRLIYRREAQALNDKFWDVAFILGEIDRREAWREYGAGSFKDWLILEGAEIIGQSVSWGMLAKQASRLLAEEVRHHLPPDPMKRLRYEQALAHLSMGTTQVITPKARRLLLRADGTPLPSDPNHDQPITHQEAAVQIFEWVTSASEHNSPAETRNKIDADEKKIEPLGSHLLPVAFFTPDQQAVLGIAGEPDDLLIWAKLWINPTDQPEGRRDVTPGP